MKRTAFILLGIALCGAGIGILLQFRRNPVSQQSVVPTFTIPASNPTPYPAVTLQRIISADHDALRSTIPEEQRITLIATGDVIPARSVNQQAVKRNDFAWAWKNIIPVLTGADITLINLETPLISGCPVTVEGMVFCGSERHIEGLKQAGVTIANLANNHTGNHGQEGIENTRELLEKNAIRVSGLGVPATVEVNGTRIGFLGFDDIGPHVPPVASADEGEIRRQVAETRKTHDLVVVSMSWGTEYTDTPSDRQQTLAHLAVDSGADLVIGNHPHWIQPVEFYKGKFIMYAHGNLIFDQMWSEKTKEGVIGIYTFAGKTLVDVEYVPTYIRDYGQPQVLEGVQKQRILDELDRISSKVP